MSDDQQLIAECLEGRKSAFDELVRRYEDRLACAMHRRLRSVEDAQDVVQEAFILAYQSLDRFRGESGFYTWLYSIASRAATCLKRRHRALVSLDSRSPNGERLDLLDHSSCSLPVRALELAEDLRQLRQALGHLAPGEHHLLMLRYAEGHKYGDLARRLNLPVGTIRSRLHRVRQKLRELLRVGEATIQGPGS